MAAIASLAAVALIISIISIALLFTELEETNDTSDKLKERPDVLESKIGPGKHDMIFLVQMGKNKTNNSLFSVLS